MFFTTFLMSRCREKEIVKIQPAGLTSYFSHKTSMDNLPTYQANIPCGESLSRYRSVSGGGGKVDEDPSRVLIPIVLEPRSQPVEPVPIWNPESWQFRERSI